MSKHINMTGHYKVAGRERQGEGILPSSEKGAYAQQLQETRREAIESEAGPPAWETTPPNLEITDRPKAPAKRGATKRKGRKSGKARTGKAAPRRKAARVASRPARRRSGTSTAARRTRRTGARKK